MKKTISVILVLSLTVALFCGVSITAKKTPKINKRKVTLYVGKSTNLKVKNNKKKVKWTSSKKSVAKVSKKGKVTAKKKGIAWIYAKVGKKKLKCKVTVKVKAVDKRKATLVENFQNYQNGYNWPVYTLGEGLTSGGTEKAHYLASDETMKVITDPEKPSNKVLQIKPKFYSFAPVLTIDLAKLTGDSKKKLSNYSGVRAKVRVVSDASTHTGKAFAAFMGKSGSIDKRYAFLTYTTSDAALPSEREFYKFYYTKAMATGDVIGDNGRMPQFNISSKTHAKGHKFSENEKAVGFATKTLNFTQYLTNEIKNQSTFDIVLGASYGTPMKGEYLAWYIDDIELLS